MTTKMVRNVGLLLLMLTALIGMHRALRAHEAPPAASVVVAEPSERASRHDREPARSDQTRQLEELRGEVEALRAELRLVRKGADEPEPASEPHDELLEEMAQQAAWEEHMSYVEAEFHDEPLEARWAADTGALIQRRLAQKPELAAVARGLECRSRSCRVELRDDGSGAVARELPLLVHELGAELPTVQFDRVEEASGRVSQVVYFSRVSAHARADTTRPL